MHRKETVQITFVGMALLAIVITMSSSTPALGVGHWNLDEDFTPSSGLSEDGMDSFDTSDNTGMEVEDFDIVDVTNEDSTTEQLQKIALLQLQKIATVKGSQKVLMTTQILKKYYQM